MPAADINFKPFILLLTAYREAITLCMLSLQLINFKRHVFKL